MLPGPASSQVGIAIGMVRAGLLGGIAAWVGFTLPSAAALVAFAYGLREFDVTNAAWLHGLLIAAVAVVANAVWGMARNLAPDRDRATIAALAAIVMLASPHPLTQIAVIAAGAAIGWRLLRASALPADLDTEPLRTPGRRLAVGALVCFAALLGALPLARAFSANHAVALVDSFYRAGALVFGGGHVVLPLLQAAVVPPGWIANHEFIAGYGAAQAVPGPLFSFAAYLGAAMTPAPNGWLGGAVALVAIYLPSFFLVTGLLPFWGALRARMPVRSALLGVNAAVVGLLLSALYTPVWTSAVARPADFALVVATFGLLALWKLPPWVVVVCAAVAAQVFLR
jgi:chromate transporter